MITYVEACRKANMIREDEFPDCIYPTVIELPDRWVFTFSVFASTDWQCMAPAPSFFMYKEDGRVEWYSIPPLSNLELIESGQEIDFIEQ